MFQSLSGFFRPCNRMAGLLGVAGRVSFNPCRVFSGLATSIREIRGLSEKEFQSLSGFFRPCDALPPLSSDTRPSVSIPVGFFQALQHHRNVKDNAPHSHSFNPCRVFSGLATDGKKRFCHPACFVSIPVGFFQALQLDVPRHRYPAVGPVSIPVGFFQALQRSPLRCPSDHLNSFNPCRVFSGLATCHSLADEMHFPSFNPCRVFSGLATHPLFALDRQGRIVSIPVGFFQALQRRCGEHSDRRGPGFNPCRVFSGLATSPS